MSSAPEYTPPPQPDPHMVARAQGQQERQTSRANNLFLNPTVKSPFGKVSYGNNEETIDGEIIRRPEQTVELSPQEQEAYERSHQIRGLMGRAAQPLGEQLMHGVTGLGEMPYTAPNFEGVQKVGQYNPEDRQRYEKAYYERANELMRPDYERQENRLRSRLAAMGHPVGNEAYHNEMDAFERNRDRAQQGLANEAILQGGGEAQRMFGLGQGYRQEQLAEAMRPYEIGQVERRNRMGENQFNLAALQSLLGGQMPQMPQLQQFNGSAMRAPDIQGIFMNNAAQAANNYNTGFQHDMANHMGHMQGLYGLGAAGLGAAGSYYGRKGAGS